ncbi:MAG: glutamate ligase domain-containing protein [Oscillospiraceae bacterium]
MKTWAAPVRGPCGPSARFSTTCAPAAWQCCAATSELLNGLDLPFETLRCGRSEHCNVRVTDIVRRGIDGLDCTVTTPRRSYRLSIPPPGDYTVYSASMAVAIGEYLGLSEQEIVEGVAGYVSTGSRMRRIRLPEDRLIIDDCYNANPQAMEAALEILADTACRRRVAVLGRHGELGPISRDAHLQVGRTTARLGLDAVIGHRPQAPPPSPETAGPRAQHFAAIEEALPALRREFTPGTAVLVKASHAMEFGKIVSELEKCNESTI